MSSRRAGLWLLAVVFTPLAVVGSVMVLTSGDTFAWPYVIGCAVIAAVVDTWLVRDLTGHSRSPR